MEVPTWIQPDLYDFLTSEEESKRSAANELLNHAFFQNKQVVQFSTKQTEEDVAVQRNNSPEVVLNELQSLSQMSNGQSRINNEFEFLQHLGKGAYGDVIKVRNKLDGGYYAIKRIQLNPKNKSLNKKIVREVKLLSRLNHENVVRYYNSWIETTTIKEEICTSTETSTCTTNERVPVIMRKDEFTIDDNIEALAPSIKNVEVSVTYDGKSQAAFDSSSDDSSDDEEEWGIVFNEDSDFDGIEFEHNSGTQSKSSMSSTHIQNSESVETATQEIVKQIDFMYIQMEFCEKSTLRTAIDDNLYLNEDRLWRLFREIVEGLVHIHQQGMIHRDLKPVNIFLDSEDHVKIGDFGLATTNIKAKQFETSKSAMEIEKDNICDESKTGGVGTALYAAPEISSSCKVVYNQKVDIYSLGIILFEMCYKPLTTSMERIKILTKLRLPEIVLPEEFSNKKSERQVFLIKWLLNHDISKRPTSQELLLSEHIPPPVLEERELQELVRHTLSNPQLKGYKYLIASCFEQPVAPAQDITYDKDPSALTVCKPLQVYDYVKGICEKEGKASKYHMQNYLIIFGLPDSSIHLLINLLNSEFEITKCISHFQMITKKKQSEASQLARQALQDLKLICQNAVAYGVPFEMVVSPGLVYNIQQYSGVIFQFVCEIKKKNKHNSMEVVAAGGRYDGMIAYYRILVEQANMLNKGVQQSAVGISFSLDKLVQAIQKEQSDDLPKMDPVDVVVCSVGFKQMVKEKTKILRSLWLAGIKCFLIESTNIEEIQEQLIELKVSHVFILKENEHGTVRVRSWERDR
ncbi:unnamed protein product, partial [Callosobruchus maculatus]